MSKKKAKRVKIICNCCKKEFEVLKSKSYNKKYCSNKCKYKSVEGNNKIDLDLDKIKDLYLNKKLSANEIGDKLGVQKKVILKRLNDIGINRRSTGESKSLYFKNNPDKNPFVREDVKKIIKKKLIAYHKNKSNKNREIWKNKISESLKNISPEMRIDQLRKSYETKLKNGTLYQSNMKKSIVDFIKSLNIMNIIENDYSILGTKELDIYLPDHKLAIEFNGLFWHSERANKDKNYHINKTIECEKQGIHLIHIFEDEWLIKQDIVKSIIKANLKINDRIIYGRKCEIEKIKDCKDFLNNNHIQGNSAASIKYGLYYEDELVSVLTFGKSRFNKKYDWEILRFANLKNTKVIGSFAKLLKAFERENNGSIITYSDRRYFNGSIYRNNGFNELDKTKPGYYYTDYKYRYNRQKFMKHKLNKLLENFDPILTEWENMQLNGWDRIWDCGNHAFYK